MGNKGIDAERERKQQLEKAGYFVSRSPGSLSCWDIFASNHGQTRLEQIKKTRNKAYYFTKESKAQLISLKEIHKQYGIPCYFTVKFIRKGWVCFPVEELSGSPIKFCEKQK